MLIHHRFGLESPNLHQTCILGYSQLVLKMWVVDLDLQGNSGHSDLEIWEICLVFSITCNGFELESPNLQQICILGFPRLILKMGFINCDLQDHLAILSLPRNDVQHHSCILILDGQGVLQVPAYINISFIVMI